MPNDVWELCKEAFGKVPAAWKAKLEAMGDAYTEAELARAFQETKDGGGRNIGYTETILRRLKDERGAAPRQPLGKSDRLLCDGCRLPAYLDSMAVCLGLGLCRECAHTPQPEPGWQRIFELLGKAAESGLAKVLDLGDEMPAVGGALTPTARRVEAYWEGVTA